MMYNKSLVQLKEKAGQQPGGKLAKQGHWWQLSVMSQGNPQLPKSTLKFKRPSDLIHLPNLRSPAVSYWLIGESPEFKPYCAGICESAS